MIFLIKKVLNILSNFVFFYRTQRINKINKSMFKSFFFLQIYYFY